MNYKSYESFFSIWIFFFLFGFLFLISCFLGSVSDIRKYQMVSGAVTSKNQVMILVSSKQLEWLYHNKVILIDGEKVTFSIDRVSRNFALEKEKKVHQVFLSVFTDGYFINDSIIVGFLEKKVSFLSIFFEMWKGG